ncbi:MAG: cytochrome c biogenesis protein CcsA [Pseudomonadota bacterium]|nr:cytochrome c biogenesis protein CcsA [Pseudomonadota bacterium]
MYIAFSLITALLYLSATAFLLLRLRRIAMGGETEKTGALLLWAAAIPLHALVVHDHLLLPLGLDLNIFNASALVALTISCVLWLGATVRPLENLGIAVLPLCTLSVILTQFAPAQAAIISADKPALQVHVLFSLLAYSVLTLSALQAVLLAVQDRHIHNHRPGGIIRALPPLQLMEQLLFGLIGLGVLLLSVSLATGFFYLEDIFAQHLVHKTILSILAWVVFVVLLVGRWRFGWRGRTAIRWTLGGFVVLMLAYFGSKFVLELVLERTV